MLTALELADALGRRKMADRLGVLPTAVSNAVVRGSFPSSWFCECSRMAVEAGLTTKPEQLEGLFGMKPDTPSVERTAPAQDPRSDETRKVASGDAA